MYTFLLFVTAKVCLGEEILTTAYTRTDACTCPHTHTHTHTRAHTHTHTPHSAPHFHYFPTCMFSLFLSDILVLPPHPATWFAVVCVPTVSLPVLPVCHHRHLCLVRGPQNIGTHSLDCAQRIDTESFECHAKRHNYRLAVVTLNVFYISWSCI